MDRDIVDYIVMGLVVLDELLFAEIVDADVFGTGACEDPGLLGVEEGSGYGVVECLVFLD